MADSVFKLTVNSKEYDDKIQRATNGLIQFQKRCRDLGGTLEVVEKDELDFVKALGKMETVSSSAVGKLGELKKAFTELSMQYKQLTDAERNSPYGKALAGSLDQLKGRIKGLESDMSSVKGELTSFGDAFKQIGNKIGIPAELFTKMGIALGAAAAAVKVATDAFKSNEEIMDEWGRTTEAASSIYSGFLNALNTGDVSGFVMRMGEISAAAREAYDAMDKLQTYNAFNQINLQKAETEFRQTSVDYREGNASKSDVRAAADAWKKELETRKKMEMDVYLAKIKDLATEKGIDVQLLTDALSGQWGDYETLKNTPLTKHVTPTASRGGVVYNQVTYTADTQEQKLGQALRQLNDDELNNIQALGKQAEATANQITDINRQVSRLLRSGQNTSAAKSEPLLPAGSIAALRKELADANKAYEMETTDEGRASAKARVEELTAALEKLTGVAKTASKEVSTVVTGAGGYSQEGIGGLRKEIQNQMASMQIGSKEYIVQAERLVDLKAFENLLQTAVQNGIVIPPQLLEDTFEKIDVGIGVSDDEWKTFVDDLNERLKALNLPPIQLDVSTGGVKEMTEDVKTMNTSWVAAAQAIGQVGSAMQNLDDPEAKVAGIVAQAIASVASGLGQMLSQPQSTSQSWGWIALAMSATATMLATVSSIKSAVKFAGGGMVGGNSYSGDNIVARLNSGEGVLTATGIENAAEMASTVRGPIVQVTGKLRGKDLLLVADNYNASRGGSRGAYANVKM